MPFIIFVSGEQIYTIFLNSYFISSFTNTTDNNHLKIIFTITDFKSAFSTLASSKYHTMEQEQTFEYYLEQAKKLMEQGYDAVSIENQLKQKGMDASALPEILKQLKLLRNRKRTKTGSQLALAGVLLLGAGFISCIVIHINGGDIGFSLYGITAVGAVVLIAGLVFIFN